MTEKQGIFIAVGAFGALYLWKQKGGANPLTSLLKKPATTAGAAGIRSSSSQPSAALVAGKSGPLPPAATGAGPTVTQLTTGIAKTISDIAKLFSSGATASKTADPKTSSSPTSGPSGSSGGSSGQSGTQNGSVWQDGLFTGPSTFGTSDGSMAPGGGLQMFDTLGTYDSAQEGIAVSDPSGGTGVGPGMQAYYDDAPGLDENAQEDASGPALEQEVAPLDSTQTVPGDSMDDGYVYDPGTSFIFDDGATGGGGGGDEYEYGPDSGLDGNGE